jgi:hypothetical protein
MRAILRRAGWPAAGLAVLLAPWAARAQVEVRCEADRRTYIQCESIRINLTLRNTGGQTLDLSGEDPDSYFRFIVERGPGRPAEHFRNELAAEPIVLGPHESAERKVDLLSAFDMAESGSYSVLAQVVAGTQVATSPKIFVDVVPGFEIGRLRMVPAVDPEDVYLFSLRYVNRGTGDSLLLRVDSETENACRGVYDLGRLIRLTPPVLESDSQDVVHVLHQSGPKLYTHSRFTFDGDPIERLTIPADGGARLKPGENGQLEVELLVAPMLADEASQMSLKDMKRRSRAQKAAEKAAEAPRRPK